MSTRQQIIDELASDLVPTRRPLGAPAAVAVWFAASWLMVSGLILVTGPMRAGFAAQLAGSPHFLLESLLGLTVGAVTIYCAMRLGTPSAGSLTERVGPGVALALVWFVAIVYGLYDPALEPSMLGKRPHCFIETFVYSVPPLLLAFAMLRRRAALRRGWAGAMVGLAAASLPALMMELACMYDPVHILTLHLSPLPVVAAVAAAIGVKVLPRI